MIFWGSLSPAGAPLLLSPVGTGIPGQNAHIRSVMVVFLSGSCRYPPSCVPLSRLYHPLYDDGNRLITQPRQRGVDAKALFPGNHAPFPGRTASTADGVPGSRSSTMPGLLQYNTPPFPAGGQQASRRVCFSPFSRSACIIRHYRLSLSVPLPAQPAAVASYLPGSASGYGRTVGCSPWSRAFPPSIPPHCYMFCSLISPVLCPCPTS